VLELTIRLIASLAVVVGLMLLLARVVGKRFAARPGAPVQVLHRQPLSRSASVTVLTVGQRVLVVGTTEHQVSLLAELDPEEVALDIDLGADAAGEELVVPPVLLPAPAPTAAPAPVRRAGTHRADSHRAAAPQRTTGDGALAGSVLSPDTWRQALAAVTGRAS
jgi:flagellar protein FliO/FliZ